MHPRWTIWTLLLSLTALALGLLAGSVSSSGAPTRENLADRAPGPALATENAEPAVSPGKKPPRLPAPGADTAKSTRTVPVSAESSRRDQGVGSLELRLEFGRTLLAGYRAEIEGVAQEWTEELRGRFTQEKFRKVVGKMQEGCDLPGELLGVDCVEPPCLAIFRIDEDQVRNSAWYHGQVGSPDCEAWEREFTKGMFLIPNLVDCPGGSQEWFAVLAPSFYWEGVTQRDVENNGKRIVARTNDIKDRWQCSEL